MLHTHCYTAVTHLFVCTNLHWCWNRCCQHNYNKKASYCHSNHKLLEQSSYSYIHCQISATKQPNMIVTACTFSNLLCFDILMSFVSMVIIEMIAQTIGCNKWFFYVKLFPLDNFLLDNGGSRNIKIDFFCLKMEKQLVHLGNYVNYKNKIWLFASVMAVLSNLSQVQ